MLCPPDPRFEESAGRLNETMFRQAYNFVASDVPALRNGESAIMEWKKEERRRVAQVRRLADAWITCLAV
jgi:hypothetical protein